MMLQHSPYRALSMLQVATRAALVTILGAKLS